LRGDFTEEAAPIGLLDEWIDECQSDPANDKEWGVEQIQVEEKDGPGNQANEDA
jgi:hypothetical protein